MKHIIIIISLLASLSARAAGDGDQWLRLLFKDGTSVCYATANTPTISRYDESCDSVYVYYGYARILHSLADMSSWSLVSERTMLASAPGLCVIVRDDRIEVVGAQSSSAVALTDLKGICVTNATTDRDGHTTISTALPAGAYELRVDGKSIKFVK